MNFPSNYEELQLKLCSNSRSKKTDKPARMGQRLIRNTLESFPYFVEHGVNYPILDIGCGDGWGLECFKNLGVSESSLFGIEYVQDRVDTARQYGFKVAKAAAEECNDEVLLTGFSNKVFNVFCSHTLEHTMDQKLAIESIQEIAHFVYLIVPVEFTSRSGNGAHFSPVRNLDQIGQYFDKNVWSKVIEEYRFNLEYEGVIAFVRKEPLPFYAGIPGVIKTHSSNSSGTDSTSTTSKGVPSIPTSKVS